MNTRILNCALLVMSAFLPTAPMAQAMRFSSIEEYARTLPNTTVETWATGDLNGDGYQDVVASLVQATGTDFDARRLVVLLADDKGRLALSATSGSDNVAPKGSSLNEFELEVRNGSFIVMEKSLWQGCGVRRRLQFRLAGNVWRLIGAKKSDGRSEGYDSRIVEQDVNLVTGEEELAVDGRTKRRRFKPVLLTLAEFPYDDNAGFHLRYTGKPPC